MKAKCAMYYCGDSQEPSVLNALFGIHAQVFYSNANVHTGGGNQFLSCFSGSYSNGHAKIITLGHTECKSMLKDIYECFIMLVNY